jgi:hypothetical protein
VLLGAPMAKADWMTPTGVVNNSAGNSAPSIDGDLATYGTFSCDDGVNDNTDNDIITGFVLYDLGSAQQVNGFKFWSRNDGVHLDTPFNPKDVTFFYVTNDNLANFTAAGYTTEAQVAASPYITTAASMTFPGVTVNSGSPYEADFVPAEQFTAQNAGLLMTTGYDTPSNKRNYFAEVQFNLSPVSTPEPSTLVLVIAGLAGLLCYAWRRRK